MSRFLCIVVGTSGVVYPASSYAGIAKAAGAETVFVNLEVTDQVDDFDRFYCGKATDILPGLLAFHSF
jgi:NAD-dependent deacetylase